MSHETMLAWLDKANSGAIQGASDRLVSAATEIRKIAEDLKVRPQMVEWKGEGADAFRTWSADLANATLRLGDYSEGASKWLAQASDALASAQVAIPRTDASAEANLEAAQAARNDPDASAVQKKSLETLLAAKESNRQEAAAQMRRLAQSYSFSASQMDGLEKPVFPPPPGAIVPDRKDVVAEGEAWGPGGSGSGSAGSGSGPAAYASASPAASNEATAGVSGSSGLRPPVPSDVPVDMEIDGVATLPPSPTTTPAVSPTVPPVTGKTDAILPVGPMATTPPVGGRSTLPPGLVTPGKQVTATTRPPGLPGPSALGTGPASRLPRDGITGGRPVAQTTGRPTGGLPRGTVVGSEGTHAGRAPMGHGGGMGGGGAAQNGIVGGRRLAGETGGVVGGRPQQPGRTSTRPFTPGGTGLVRNAASTEGARQAGSAGRGGSAQRPGESRRDERERPDYLVEDEETWQQGSRRIVPPVID
ncbi:WXG100 family type VII secretion target [Streptomyces sp. NPDC002908]|uniref:WXG100 family type VII secretion target n=1 Tax=Streptomyces sp. NPDC002908 TaxID=3364670 RepID=UPI0036A36645